MVRSCYTVNRYYGSTVKFNINLITKLVVQ